MIKVTAVILNYNSSIDCKKCIEYLKRQTYKEFSIIVVDNASSDKDDTGRLQEICDSEGVKLIISKTNGGFSAGNNIGLRAAIAGGAEWMLVINPDVEVRDPNYISYVMNELPKWENVAVIGTNILLPDGTKQNPMRELQCIEEILWPLEILKQRIGLGDGYKMPDRTGYCEKVSGCCFFITRRFLEVNNFLDENVFMYCEEPILCKSVMRMGFKELYIHEVTANHEHYDYKKSGTKSFNMPIFFKSRVYYIKEYSGYPTLLKNIAIVSRKIESKIWRK